MSTPPVRNTDSISRPGCILMDYLLLVTLELCHRGQVPMRAWWLARQQTTKLKICYTRLQ
jgi:hypothetical protein